jgi:hypothetical protein
MNALSRVRRSSCCLSAAGLVVLVCLLPAQGADWLAGPALDAQLALPVTFRFARVGLRSALDDVAKLQRSCVVLDRRVDPSQSLEFAAENLPLDAALGKLAEQLGLGYSRLGPIGYLGPKHTAEGLRTLAAVKREEVDRLPSAVRAAWLKKAPASWPDFSEPRSLVERFAGEALMKLGGLKQIPHDLWPAADWPALTLLDRLTLLLAEFDLMLEFDKGGHAQLVAWPDKVMIERQYPGGTRAQDLATRWAEIAPAAEVRVVGSKLVVRARVEDHELFAGSRKLSTPAMRERAAGEQVHTLNLDGVPLDKVLDFFAKRLDLRLHYDRDALTEAGIALDQPISLHVEKATTDELLRQALEPAGLRFRREGKEVTIEKK